MPFVFEEGEGIQTGAHGEHDFVFADGDAVTDRGKSSSVFEAGTGIGGKSGLIVDGVSVGIYETAETGSSFWDYQNIGSGVANAQGLKDAGVDDAPGDLVMYIFAHHDTANDVYSLAVWIYGDGDSGASTDWSGSFTLHDYGSVWNGTVEQSDDPGEYEGHTNSNGDPYVTNMGYFQSRGDGVLLPWDGSAFTITLEANTPDTAVEWRGRGPDGTQAVGISSNPTVEYA